jgi:pimeloyl-ACP methyl ester carboxylesterase
LLRSRSSRPGPQACASWRAGRQRPCCLRSPATAGGHRGAFEKLAPARRPGHTGVVADPSRIPDDLLELFDARLAIPGGEESWRSIARNTHPNRTTFSLHSELEGLRTPTLLIWGEQDRIDPPVPAATAIAKRLPNARLELLPDAGHMPWFDKSDECATLVTEFLR